MTPTAWRFRKRPTARVRPSTSFLRSFWALDAAEESRSMAACTAVRMEVRANGGTTPCRGCRRKRFPVPPAIAGGTAASKRGCPERAWKRIISVGLAAIGGSSRAAEQSKLSSTHALIFARLGPSWGQGLSPVVPAKRNRAMAEVQTTGTQAVVRNISDTARWAAVFRARESERTDALFRDPYAERLAGKMGVDIANTLPEGNRHAWPWVARTYLFDHFIRQN